MPTSLVTGGAGFLGSHLCDRLLAEGHRVLCVDNLDTGTLENIEHIRSPGFVFAQHDMIGHLEVSEPIDYVFHLASPASPIDYLRLPLHTLKVGSYGTHNALGLAKAHRARFLLASHLGGVRGPEGAPPAGGLLGARQPDRPARLLRRGETLRRVPGDGLPPRNTACDTTSRASSTPTGRGCTPTTGGWSRPSSAGPAGEPLTVAGEGIRPARSVTSPTWSRGFPPDASEHGCDPVNLGNPREFTILELAELLIELTASSSSVVDEALPQDDPAVRRPDISLARELLDWEPTVELREGLVMTLSGMNAELPLRR